MIYDIHLNSSIIGQAEVSREGLYYNIVCRCQLPVRSLCKIQITCEDQTELLGTPVPTGKEFILRKKIPVKQLPGSNLSFAAVEKRKERFVPIYSDQPFEYISQLKTAHLEYRNGQIGIALRDV